MPYILCCFGGMIGTGLQSPISVPGCCFKAHVLHACLIRDL